MREDIISSPRLINEFVFKEDFLNCVNKFNSFDGKIFIISNQPDVARNLLSLETLEKINIKIKKLINPTEIIYCTCDGIGCDCKKPKPKMITSLINKYNLINSECLFVGDSIKDIEAGNSASIKTVFLETDYNINQNPFFSFKINSLNELFNLNLF